MGIFDVLKKKKVSKLIQQVSICKMNKDYKKAVELLNEAIKLEDSYALVILGGLYAKGNGVEKDKNKAISLYYQAAEMGNSLAFELLAECHYFGIGTNIDYKKALEFANKAMIMSANAEKAWKVLGKCYLYGHGVEKNIQKGVQYLKDVLTVSEYDSEVQYILGCIYLEGDEKFRDYKEAVILLQKASDALWPNAKEKLIAAKEQYNIEEEVKWLTIDVEEYKDILDGICDMIDQVEDLNGKAEDYGNFSLREIFLMDLVQIILYFTATPEISLEECDFINSLVEWELSLEDYLILADVQKTSIEDFEQNELRSFMQLKKFDQLHRHSASERTVNIVIHFLETLLKEIISDNGYIGERDELKYNNYIANSKKKYIV